MEHSAPPPRPKIMGILNVTPDSFSDGGAAFEPAHALAKFIALAAAGADIIDIGAESTRPGAMPLNSEQEWARLQPVLAPIMAHPARKTVALSIDTRHAETARLALAMGADIINDVSGLRDAAMRDVLAKSGCEIVVMHALTIPADPAVTLVEDADPVAAILQWKTEIQAVAATSGIAQERLIFDPGIGFGKTAKQSLELMLRAPELIASGGNWLYGHSRKSFLALMMKNNAETIHHRDALTLEFSKQLATSGVQILRVHDVAAHRQLFEQLCT